MRKSRFIKNRAIAISCAMAGLAVFIACNSPVTPPTTYQLTVIAAAGGTITAPSNSPVTVTKGAATAISALPNIGYSFVNWTVTSGAATFAHSDSASTTVTLTSGSATVQASFTIKQYSIRITSDNGTVVKNPNQSLYDSNTTVTLTPTSAAQLAVVAGAGGVITAPSSSPVTVTGGYQFTDWGGDLSGSANPATITMNTNKNVTANFSSNYNQATVTVISAVPNAGYVFCRWTDTSGNASIGYMNSVFTTARLIYGDATVQASFIQIVSPLTPIDISAFQKENGANFSYYTGTWTVLPDFSALTPDSSGPCDSLDVTAVPHQSNNFGVVFTAYFNIPMAGKYTFYLRSSDGSQLLLNDSVIINNDGVHSSPVEDSATVSLADYPSVNYQIEVRYFDASSSPSLWVGYSCTDFGIDKQTIIGALQRPFTGPVPKIIMTQPAGGETYRLGDSMHVRWIYKNPRAQVFVSISVDNGVTFNLISIALPGDITWYDWKIPNDNSYITQSAFIEVDEYPPYNLYALSNKFSIVAAAK